MTGFAKGQGTVNKGQEGGSGQTPHGTSKEGSYGLAPTLKTSASIAGSALVFHMLRLNPL